MSTNQAKSASTTFGEVVQRYEQYLGRSSYKGQSYFREIQGVLSICTEHFSHFGIRDFKKNMFIIEFYVEKEKDTLLYTIMKRKEYWKKVHIFDKEIKYDPNYRIGGTIFIECDYSLDVENICAYISEFIYQVKSRIECMMGSSK
jgi:hypothetical protein